MSQCFEGQSGAGTEIINNVIRMMPGVPEAEARQYVEQAMREFARSSGLWTFKDFELDVCRGDQVVEIPADEGIDIQSVDKVLVAESSGDTDCWHEMGQGDEAMCQSVSGDLPWRDNMWQVTSHQQGQVRFARPFRHPHRLRFHLTLAPADGSDTFPPHLLSDNRRAIEAGALGFGYMIPGQAWSDAERGLYFNRLWDAALLKAEEEKKSKAALARLDMRPGRPAYCRPGIRRGCYSGGFRSDTGGVTSCESGGC